jgi:hypothetical protein
MLRSRASRPRAAAGAIGMAQRVRGPGRFPGLIRIGARAGNADLMALGKPRYRNQSGMLGRRYPGPERNAERYAIRTLSGC